MKTLNLFSITFKDTALEKAYIKSTQNRTLYQGRIAILVGIFVYLLFGFLDQWFVPSEVSATVWNIRFTALCVPIIVLILSFTSLFLRFSYLLLAIVGLAAGAGLITIQMYLPIESVPYYYPMMILVVFYTYNFIGTRFTYALRVDLILLLSYNIIFGWIIDYPLYILLSHNALIISANLIGGSAGYLVEWQKRILFLREQELEEERKLHQHRSLHDTLTGLVNRELAYDRLGHIIELSHYQEDIHCVFFIDLDGFKAINDNLGHMTGDTVLKEVAKRLSSIFREGDIVARIGGDEFFILVLNIDKKEIASNMGEQILQQISQPIFNVPSEFSLSASIGICLFPYQGMSSLDILNKADKAMYEVKKSGKGNFLFAN